MGIMKKAKEALGFGKAQAMQAQPVSASQVDIAEVPAELRTAFMSHDSSPSSVDAPCPPFRASADGVGRRGQQPAVGMPSQSMRALYGPLDSPTGSTAGTPKGPSCTGGGHGEAPPSLAGTLHPHQKLGSPLHRLSSSNMQLPSPLCTATATPLARHLANRALRKAGDSAPVTLPSLTGGAKLRDLVVPTAEPPSPAAAAPAATSPRPPAPVASRSMHETSPRVRRATTVDVSGDGLGSSGPISPTGSSALLAPSNSVEAPRPERFQRLQSMPHHLQSQHHAPAAISPFATAHTGVEEAPPQAQAPVQHAHPRPPSPPAGATPAAPSASGVAAAVRSEEAAQQHHAPPAPALKPPPPPLLSPASHAALHGVTPAPPPVQPDFMDRRRRSEACTALLATVTESPVPKLRPHEGAPTSPQPAAGAAVTAAPPAAAASLAAGPEELDELLPMRSEPAPSTAARSPLGHSSRLPSAGAREDAAAASSVSGRSAPLSRQDSLPTASASAAGLILVGHSHHAHAHHHHHHHLVGSRGVSASGMGLPPFVARPVPGEGLVHLSRAAPPQMLRPAASWGVADFKIVRKLYAGYASSVYKATCQHSEVDVVLKAYNLTGLSSFLRHQVLRELDIHSRLQHAGVVHLVAAFREGDILVLVLEYVRGGSLDRVRRKLGGRMTEFQTMHLVLLPLLNVLAYLHSRGIIHRDIKPENLLFTEDWGLKVCDYGVSICLQEERAVTRTGSREYMAPEVNVCPLKRGPEDNKDNEQLAYTSAVDVWSLGVLLYELLVGFTPFPGGPPPRKDSAAAAVTAGGAAKALAFPSSVSQEARAFVQACLELEPGDRPTIQQLLMHTWIQNALDQEQKPMPP